MSHVLRHSRASASTPPHTRPVRRRLAMLPTAGLLAVAFALSTAGCGAQPAPEQASDETLATLATLEQWSAADAAERSASLAADSRELGTLLVAAAGLPDMLGMSAEDIESALVRSTPPAAAAAPAPDGPSVDTASALSSGTGSTVRARVASGSTATDGAALSSVETLLDRVSAGLASDTYGDGETTEDADTSDGWTSSETGANGGLVSSAQSSFDTVVNGVTITTDTTATAEMSSCPDAQGKVEGTFTVSGGVSAPGPDGTVRKAQTSLLLTLTATVDDDAWAVDAVGTVETFQQTGAPGAPGGFSSVDSTSRGSATVTVGYAGGGTVKVGRATVSKVTGDASTNSVVRSLGVKMQQGVLESAEAFWRAGNCVDVTATATPENIGRAGSTSIAVSATARNGSPAIPTATAEYTGENRGSVGGTVSPATPQSAPATFTFVAENADGTAAPQFSVTSRRGIGFGTAAVNVGQFGWVIDTVVYDQHFTAIKCNGVVGEWSLAATGPEGYRAVTGFVLDDMLRGSWTGTVVDTYTWAGEVWFVEEGAGYVMHATGGDFDPMLPVRPAAPGECGR